VSHKDQAEGTGLGFAYIVYYGVVLVQPNVSLEWFFSVIFMGASEALESAFIVQWQLEFLVIVE